MNNFNNANTKYYWYEFFDINNRVNILKNNTNFYLSNNDLEELVKKKCTFWNKRNLSFRQYIKAYYTDFKEKIVDEVRKLTSLDPLSDVLMIWWNYNRVLEITAWLDNVLDDDLSEEDIEKKNKEVSVLNNYKIDRVSKYQEIKDILKGEYILLDLETTWFNKLNQIIEFWCVVYNRAINLNTINETQYINNEKLFLSIFKYFKSEFINDNFDKFIELSTIVKDYNNNFNKELENKINSNIEFNVEYKYEQVYENIFTEYNKNNKSIIIDFLNNNNFIENLSKNITLDILFDKFKIIDNFDFKYNKKIHFYIEHYKDYSNKMNESIHHITNETRTKKWKKIDDIIPALQKLLDGWVILAHNAWFDMWKISEFFNDFKIKWPNIKAAYDTINFFQIINKEMNISNKVSFYNLDYLTKLYLWVNLSIADDESSKDRHTAIYDVNLTNANLNKAINVAESYIKDKEHNLINEILINIWKWIVEKKSKKEKIEETTGIQQIWLF